MKRFIIALIIIMNLILQGTLFQYIRIFGVMPNTALILVVCLSLRSKKNGGALIGFITGILMDILYGLVIGFNALIFMLVGYLIGIMNPKIFKDNYATPFILTALFTVFYEGASYLISYFLGYNIEFVYILRRLFMIEILYNSIISPVAYFYVSKLFRKRAALMKNIY